MKHWCRLAVLTDEVSQDLDAVVRFAREFSLEGIELRSLFGKAFRDLSDHDINATAQRCRDEGLAVAGCASPVFKCPLDAPSDMEEHIDLFRRSVDVALKLGCDLVRVFTFLRRGLPTSSTDLARAAECFHPLLEIARASGVRIGVENEASCLVGTGPEMTCFLGHLPLDPLLTVVWDPCNVLYLDGTSDPVRDDFPLVANRVGHVHVKDASRIGRRAAERCVELGQGDLNLPGQLAALRRQSYQGWITLETHWRDVPLDDESQHLPAGHAFSAHAEPASRICMRHLQRMIQAA